MNTHSIPGKWRWWYAFAAVFASTFAIVAFTLVYTGRVAERINSEWCDVAIPVTDAYKENPPPTDAGKALQRAMEDKRNRLC
jgi:hypothetical protein